MKLRFLWYFAQTRKGLVQKKLRFLRISSPKGAGGSGPIQNYLKRKHLGIQIEKAAGEMCLARTPTTTKKTWLLFKSPPHRFKGKNRISTWRLLPVRGSTSTFTWRITMLTMSNYSFLFLNYMFKFLRLHNSRWLLWTLAYTFICLNQGFASNGPSLSSSGICSEQKKTQVSPV